MWLNIQQFKDNTELNKVQLYSKLDSSVFNS
jgi:hypothetical protein